MGSSIKVATYNVHRWTGLNGRRAPDPARAGFVISELNADVIALQEVLRPTDEPCPLVAIADALPCVRLWRAPSLPAHGATRPMW